MFSGGTVSAGEIGQMNEISDPVLTISAKVGSRTIRLAALHRGGGLAALFRICIPSGKVCFYSCLCPVTFLSSGYA